MFIAFIEKNLSCMLYLSGYLFLFLVGQAVWLIFIQFYVDFWALKLDLITERLIVLLVILLI